jgi:hypothetical protein
LLFVIRNKFHCHCRLFKKIVDGLQKREDEMQTGRMRRRCIIDDRRCWVIDGGEETKRLRDEETKRQDIS